MCINPKVELFRNFAFIVEFFEKTRNSFFHRQLGHWRSIYSPHQTRQKDIPLEKREEFNSRFHSRYKYNKVSSSTTEIVIGSGDKTKNTFNIRLLYCKRSVHSY